MSEAAIPGEAVLTRDARDPLRLANDLATWLAPTLQADGVVTARDAAIPSGTGMSSATVLLTLDWTRNGEPHSQRFAARLPPLADAFPVFPAYDLAGQFAVMAVVGERTAAPVPHLVAIDADGSSFGFPVAVMEAIEGRTPLDNPPYVFGGWLLDADADERRALQDATVRLIADVHGVADAAIALPDLAPEGDPLRAHVEQQRAYYAWTIQGDGMRVPLIERAFEWIEEHWPAPAESVLCWGDSRPANVLYDGFVPAAALDWEMAMIGPRELDLGWLVFMHRFFQDIAEIFELPGLPDFARREDVSRVYEEHTGHVVQDLDWYVTYAALRHAIVMSQIKRRMVHFGDEPAPDHPDDYIMHRAALEALLEERYAWS